MTPTNGTVLVFLKSPKPGSVKTRLAATIGFGPAAELYRHWIGEVLKTLQPLRPGVRIVGAIDGRTEAFGAWESFVDAWWSQPVGDLGQRLDAGFRQAHENTGPVVAVGTDCLELDTVLVDQAFLILRRRDVVFGPAVDGGYYLVGTARYLTDLFEHVRWSSCDTLTDHRRRCEERFWSYELLPERHDIDTWEDWLAFIKRTGQRWTSFGS